MAVIATQKLTVKTIVRRFELDVIGGKGGLGNEIKITGINRAGFELSGAMVYSRLERIVLLGGKEQRFLSGLPKQKAAERIENLVKGLPPVIIISSSYDPLGHDLIDWCDKLNVPLLHSTKMSSSELINTVGNYVSEELLEYSTLHGVLMEIYGEGVLIKGESGIGKSEVALELIKKGHMFVADDAIDVARIAGRLHGRANPAVKNFIEVRGLGILNVTRMFGIQSIAKSTSVELVVELAGVSPETKLDFERLGAKQNLMSIEGIKIPHYLFPVSAGRNISELVESAVIDMKLRREGQNSGQEFRNYTRKLMK